RGEAPPAGRELAARAGRAGQLGAGAGTKLDGVNHRADGDGPKRERVAGPDVGALARLQLVAHPKPLPRKDVALLPVGVVEQRDASRAVGVVLDVGHLGRDAVLVAAEVDPAEPSLVAAALVTH